MGGQCVEANYAYLMDCVVPSDYFSFLLSKRPVVENKTCAELGFEAVGIAHPTYDYEVYWKGGADVAGPLLQKYRDGHPDLDDFLARSRDNYVACSKASEVV